MDVSETLKGTDFLILGSNLFVESVIDLALKSAVWQLCISMFVLSTIFVRQYPTTIAHGSNRWLNANVANISSLRKRKHP